MTHAQKRKKYFCNLWAIIKCMEKNDILTQHLPHGTIEPVPLDFPHQLTTSPAACINKLECAEQFLLLVTIPHQILTMVQWSDNLA
jgi:hypothetical protein